MVLASPQRSRGGLLARWPDGSSFGLFFPYAEALSPEAAAKHEQSEAELTQRAADARYPVELKEAYATLLAEDNERLKSVEGRLGSLFGLTSLTATLLFSGILAIANGTLGDSSRLVRVAATLCVFYLSVQIVCSTLAALRGLSRTTWLRSDVEDLMPSTGVEAGQADQRKALSACERYLAANRTINYKVTQMAIAHTAIRNFAVGSAVFAVLGLSIVFTQDRSAALSKAIHKDTQLQQLLQGRPGPPGPQGSVGVCPSESVYTHSKAARRPVSAGAAREAQAPHISK